MKKLLIPFIVFLFITIVLYSSQHGQKSVTGKVAEGTSSVSFRILGACSNILLVEGWNFVSICSNMTNKTIEAALSEINGEYRYVMEWDENSQRFLIYSPLAVENPFTYFKENKSYFIYLLPSTAEINPSGYPFGELSISLLYGWNTPVYPYEESVNISKYVSQIEGQYRYVMKWDPYFQRFLIYSPLAANPEFTNISKGEGQFIYIDNTSGAILKYNRTILN
ncbi:MAG: hypothetical protein QXG86_02325 [Candidatus Woesearchaeota archaeon]